MDSPGRDVIRAALAFSSHQFWVSLVVQPVTLVLPCQGAPSVCRVDAWAWLPQLGHPVPSGLLGHGSWAQCKAGSLMPSKARLAQSPVHSEYVGDFLPVNEIRTVPCSVLHEQPLALGERCVGLKPSGGPSPGAASSGCGEAGCSRDLHSHFYMRK